MNEVPILLLVFNRLDPVKMLVPVLSQFEPKIVYIASDGPRTDEELVNVQAVREYLLQNIDWHCDIKTLFRDKNLGCKLAVHEALQWFFSQEERGIVLEDDIIPSINFFKFCEEALDKYKDNKKISSITGRNELQEWSEKDCFTASRFQCWGWASWSDRIMGIDVEYGYKKDINYDDLYEDCLWEERFYLDSVLGLLQTRQVNSWAYPYDLNFKKNKQLQLYPSKNMVENIGFGTSGTHSSSRNFDSVDVYQSFKPFVHPDMLIIDDKNYIKQKLRTEYGGVLQLFVMRYIRYLGWLRKWKKFVYKKIGK